MAEHPQWERIAPLVEKPASLRRGLRLILDGTQPVHINLVEKPASLRRGLRLPQTLSQGL